jgi:hypothetical protein
VDLIAGDIMNLDEIEDEVQAKEYIMKDLSFETDNDLIAFATNLWANYIETFCVSISAEDAKNKIYPAKNHYEPNLLTNKQKELVQRLRTISKKYKEKNI